MRHISGDIYGLLMRQGLGMGSVGAEAMRLNKGPASSTDALCGGVEADAREEGIEYRPTAVRGDTRSRSAIGKTGGYVPPASMDGWSFDPSPASRPVLELVSSRCLGTAFPTRLPRAAVSKHLVLVVCN